MMMRVVVVAGVGWFDSTLLNVVFFSKNGCELIILFHLI